MRETVAVIGYGRFGQLAARLLSRRFRVLVHDTRRITVRGRNIRSASPAECARADAVIMAVPVERLAAAVTRIAPHLRRGTVRLDVCAVRE